MKIFNSSKKRKFVHDHRAGVKPGMTDAEILALPAITYTSIAGRTIEVPDELGAFWIKQYPKIFMTDAEANRAEAAYQQALQDKEREVSAQTVRAEGLQQQLDDLQALVMAAANGDKKAKATLAALSAKTAPAADS